MVKGADLDYLLGGVSDLLRRSNDPIFNKSYQKGHQHYCLTNKAGLRQSANEHCGIEAGFDQNFAASIDAIRRKGKPLAKLVQRIVFDADEVQGAMRRYEPDGFGRSHEETVLHHLEVRLRPSSSRGPLRSLTFVGYSPLSKGERFVAAVPLFCTIDLTSPFDEFRAMSERDLVYVPRQPQASEEAIEIVLLDDQQRIRRADRSVNFPAYLKAGTQPRTLSSARSRP